MQASEAAEQVRTTSWGNQGIPVDPVVIAKSFGLDVIETNLPDGVSGALFKDAGQDPVIFTDFNDSNNRKRFTVAHELGHFVYRSESDSLVDEYGYIEFRDRRSRTGSHAEEVFANQFAANLLMPAKEVCKEFRRNPSHLALSSRFGVSVEAIKIRLKNLKLL